MNKKAKWTLVGLIVAGLVGWGIYSQMPKENGELADAEKVVTNKTKTKQKLNVNAVVIKTGKITDEIQVTG